jgi:hypothetical protein
MAHHLVRHVQDELTKIRQHNISQDLTTEIATRVKKVMQGIFDETKSIIFAESRQCAHGEVGSCDSHPPRTIYVGFVAV